MQLRYPFLHYLLLLRWIYADSWAVTTQRISRYL